MLSLAAFPMTSDKPLIVSKGGVGKSEVDGKTRTLNTLGRNFRPKNS